jgi:tRNA threonylcarbamoyladenosine biosynthesis protein TsaE
MDKSRRQGKTLEVFSRSPEQTEQIGRVVGRALMPPCLILLCGALGSGKTTLARGLAAGFGLHDPSLVHSPSFTIVNVYHGRVPIYHVDLYRIAGGRDLRSVGLEDFLQENAVNMVEWGERLAGTDDAAIRIVLRDAGDDARAIRIVNFPRSVPGLARFQSQPGRAGIRAT